MTAVRLRPHNRREREGEKGREKQRERDREKRDSEERDRCVREWEREETQARL